VTLHCCAMLCWSNIASDDDPVGCGQQIDASVVARCTCTPTAKHRDWLSTRTTCLHAGVRHNSMLTCSYRHWYRWVAWSSSDQSTSITAAARPRFRPPAFCPAAACDRPAFCCAPIWAAGAPAVGTAGGPIEAAGCVCNWFWRCVPPRRRLLCARDDKAAISSSASTGLEAAALLRPCAAARRPALPRTVWEPIFANCVSSRSRMLAASSLSLHSAVLA
jgi:hypothetical protein